MSKIFRHAAVVAATAVVVVGCSASTEPAAQSGTPAAPTSAQATQPAKPSAEMVAHNTEAPIQDIPWSEVGPGWTLAMWNAATPTNPGDEYEPGDATPYNSETMLYLVNPDGGRYAITTFDAKATYLYVSPSSEPLTGYAPEELIGHSFFDYIHPDDKRAITPLLKQYLLQKAGQLLSGKKRTVTETIEYRFRIKDGEWRHLQSTVNLAGNQLPTSCLQPAV